MAVVLFVVGMLIYVRYRSELDSSVDRGLRSRAGDVSALLRGTDGGDPLPNRGESLGEDSFAQVLTASGRVLDTTGQSAARPVLAPPDLRRALAGPTFVERSDVPGFEGEPARLLATSAPAGGERLIVVVGTSLDDRDEALSSLSTLLLLGGPAALLLASLAGYAAVTASLRPVEAIRRRAAEISAAQAGERLPVPAADDELRRLGET